MSAKHTFDQYVAPYIVNRALFPALACAYLATQEHEVNTYVYYDRDSKQYRYTAYYHPDSVYCVTTDGEILS
jgi:hypothetical protein